MSDATDNRFYREPQEAPTSNLRLFPVQARNHATIGDTARVNERVYMAAYEVYKHVHGEQNALIDLERGCRGGFSSGELIAFLYARSFPKDEWSRRCDEAFIGIKHL